MIPLIINGKSLYEIFDPETFDANWDDDELQAQSIIKQMFPSEVALTSETYSRDAERTADYELENLQLVNRKSKPEFSWDIIRADYVTRLMEFLNYHYSFKNVDDVIVPEEAPTYDVTYRDFTGLRTIEAYLGQTLQGTLAEYEGVLYWTNFRIAFPER